MPLLVKLILEEILFIQMINFCYLELIVAETGEEDFELEKIKQPDMIILDINLPGISGIDVLNLIKSNESTRNISVYALSAAATAADIKKGMDAGFFKIFNQTSAG